MAIEGANELTATNVNTNVGIGRAHGIEKDKIAFLNVAIRDCRQSKSLLPRCPWYHYTSLRKYILNQSAAIKAVVTTLATPHIGFTNLGNRVDQHGIQNRRLSVLLIGVRWRRTSGRSIRRRWRYRRALPTTVGFVFCAASK
jgi:hypothetical protein